MKSIRPNIVLVLLAVLCAGALSSCTTISGPQGDVVRAFGPPRKVTPMAMAYAHYLAATVHERRGDFDGALRELEAAAQSAPESPTITLRLVQVYLRRNELEKALAMTERALRLIPDNANLWIVFGQIQHDLNQYDEAMTSLKKAIELEPNNPLGYGALLSLEESMNDLAAAADIYRRLAEMAPDSAGVQFQLGLCLARMNDPEGAKGALQKTLELKPDMLRARYLLGIIFMESGDNARAAEQFQMYLDLAPDDPQTRTQLAGALGRMERLDEAIGHLRTVVDGDSDAADRIGLVYLLVRAKRFPEALEALPAEGAPFLATLFQAVARKGAGEPYLPVLTSIDQVEGDLDAEGVDVLNELLFLFGKESVGAFLLDTLTSFRGEGVESRILDTLDGRILLGLNRDRDAVDTLERALERWGADPLIHYYLATAYEKLNEFEPTERHLKAYLGFRPDDPDALNFLGYLYAEQNLKLDEAEALLNRALAISPNNGFYLDSLGWVYYRRGDADKAIELIQRAIIAMDGDDAELRDHLGDAYLLKGDLKRALAEWRRALRLNPKLKGVEEKIRQHEKDVPSSQ